MPNYKAVFGSFVKTEDLQGQPAHAIIEGVTLEEMKNDKGGKEMKLVAKFVGKQKRLVLNKTKCEALAEITGTEDYEQWTGTGITLTPGTTKFGNKVVGCINVTARTGRPGTHATPPPPPEPVFDREPGEDDVESEVGF